MGSEQRTFTKVINITVGVLQLGLYHFNTDAPEWLQLWYLLIALICFSIAFVVIVEDATQ